MSPSANSFYTVIHEPRFFALEVCAATASNQKGIPRQEAIAMNEISQVTIEMTKTPQHFRVGRSDNLHVPAIAQPQLGSA